MKNFLSNLFFIYAFFYVQILSSIIPNEYIGLFYIHVLLIYFGLGLYLFKFIFLKDNSRPVLFVFMFVLFGVISMLVKQSFSALNLLIPIGTLLGYIYYKRTRINIKAYDVFFIVLYIYFYITYFALLPDLFFRPNFNEEVYVRASSNVVSQGLNLYLLFYLIAIKGKEILLPRRVIVYSTINLILIIIQGSRAGLIIGFTMFIIVLYYYLKEKNIKVSKYYFAPVILLLLLVIIKVGIPYYNSLYDTAKSFRLSEDVRSVAQKTFLDNLDSTSLYFGYPSNYQFTSSYLEGGLTYTYNVALDVWNRYSIFGLFVLLIFLFNRFLNRKAYKIPLYFMAPILIYSSVESLFLPGYWDVLLFIALFLEMKEKVNL